MRCETGRDASYLPALAAFASRSSLLLGDGAAGRTTTNTAKIAPTSRPLHGVTHSRPEGHFLDHADQGLSRLAAPGFGDGIGNLTVARQAPSASARTLTDTTACEILEELRSATPDDVHRDAQFVALADLVGQDPTSGALRCWATEHPDAWGCLAAMFTFGDPLRPLDRLPRQIARFLVAYDVARHALGAR
jgi:hypothetical protein